MQNNVYKQAAPAVLPLKKTWQGLCPFVQGDIVESRSFDEGFRDAWFLSKVLDVKQVKGPPAYELTLQCLDFDEDEPFQCPLYQTNPGLFSPEWELMVRPVPPGFHPPGSAKQEHGCRSREGLRCQLRRSYAVGDAVEYLYNFAWWSGRISEISGDRASVWWRPPPFGEGGEEVNIRFEELRPAMTWNRGHWCFPGHPQGPLGVLVTKNRVGRPLNTDPKPGAIGATGTTPETVLGKRRAGKRELVSQTRYGRMVKPKAEAQEGAEGEFETPRKPKTATGVRDGNLETAKKRKREEVPFRRGSVNESLSPEERMEVARKALQEDACSPDIGRLEEAVRTVLGCGLPSFMKKGVQFRHARFRLMLARCAETGRACPDRAHTDSVFARGQAAGHASVTEHPSSVKGSNLPPAEKGDVSGAAAGSVHGTPESSPLSKGSSQARPASGFKGAVKVTPKRGAKVDRTGQADSGGSGTSGEKREMASAVLGGQEIRDHNAELEGDLLGELMRCFQANDQASSPGVTSKPLPVASFTPRNVVPSDALEGQNEAGVLRLWDVAELGGMLLDSFDPP